MDDRKFRGDQGEAAVAAYLRRRGYKLLARQFRCRYGEIDLVARSAEGVLCFVEVKTRARNAMAPACMSVTPAKQRRLRATAQLYLVQTQLDCPCRFDVAEVYLDQAGWDRPTINYIENAF